MSKILFFILLLNSVFMFPQKNIEGRVAYAVSKTPVDIKKYTKNKKIPSSMEKMTQSLFNPNDQVMCVLNFSQTKSIFFKSKRLNNPNKKKTVTDILIGNNKYYVDLTEKTILNQKEFMGDFFLIKSNFFKWRLTQEEKKIGKYTCYKAISTRIIENSEGTFKKEVIAWYTPEISASFGPKNYCSLPGLILELSDGDLTFKAQKIELNLKKKLTIKKPNKGKNMSEVEYEQLMKKLFYEHKLRKKSN